jgi:hypothetical protein
MEDDPCATVVDIKRQLSPEGSLSDTHSTSSPGSLVQPNPLEIEDEDRKFEDSSDKGGNGTTYYHNLRPGARDGKTCFLTWWDADDSGNYDPALEGKQDKGKKKIRLVPHQSTSGEEVVSDTLPENKRRLEQFGLASRQRGCAFTLTFPYSALGEQGKALVNKIKDHWPAKYHNTLSDEYIAQQVKEMTQLAKNNPYMLRSRIDTDSKEKKITANEAPDECIMDPAGIEADLSYHPVARGCVGCRTFDVPCSLLDNESTWPCEACQEDSCDCELIIPPLKKSTCEQCRRKRLRCSYSYENSDTGKPCSHCESSRSPCIAAPAPGAIRERVRYDRDYSSRKNFDYKERRYVTCTACRADKLDCELRKKTDEPPCLSCISRGLSCTFQDVARRKKKAARVKPKMEAKLEIERKEQLLKAQGRFPENVIYIKTSFCHPISFLDRDREKCHWCTNQSYGILGLGWVDVLVQPSENGLEYHEISGGHYGNGQQTSRICVICTMQRVRIVGCPEHEMRPLDGYAPRCDQNTDGFLRSDQMDLDALDVEAAFDRLMARSVLPSDRWCCLCPSLALYQCCTPQETDMWGEAIDPSSDDAEGCGLLLCEDCTVVLNEEEDLEAVIDAMTNDVECEHWGMGARADAEFLRKEGLLIGKVCEGVDEMELGV